MRKVLTLIQTLNNLSHIPRTGGVLFAGIDPNRTDSLAEHSYKVTYLCLLLGKISRKNNLALNVEKLVETAITHDWEDCIILDIPSSSPSYRSYFKDADLRQITKKAENEAKKAIQEFVSEEIDLDLTKENLTETEKKLLEIADIIALLTEILYWKYDGLKYAWLDFMWSNTMARFRENLERNFEFLNPWVEELQKAYTTGVKPLNPFLTKPQFQTLKR